MEKTTGTYRRNSRLSIGVVMLLVAGAALGFWLALEEVRSTQGPGGDTGNPFRGWIYGFVFMLGGLSLVGPPILLWSARRRVWGAGRLLWMAHGTAAWLLWPPVIYNRIAVVNPQSETATCFFFGTPLMAVYVTAALLSGGYLRRSRRRRLLRSWQETFGLLLGLAWACTGLYFISLFYRHDILGK